VVSEVVSDAFVVWRVIWKEFMNLDRTDILIRKYYTLFKGLDTQFEEIVLVLQNNRGLSGGNCSITEFG
jgi:hypothetical protein